MRRLWDERARHSKLPRKRYAVEVSTGFISTLTDQVLDDMRAWQQRALSERYAVVYLDALVTSSRQNGIVAKRHLYVALGINMQGQKELLGLWGQATEGVYPQGASPQNICAKAHYSE